MRYFILISCLILLSTTSTFAAKITTTDQLVQAMQKKYAKSWYQTATFVQKTTNIDKDGNKKVETWYEAMSLPGSLRIDFTPTKDGNGILFTNGQIYSFKSGKVDTNRAFVHPLMILGFDIYRLSQADAIEKLKGSHRGLEEQGIRFEQKDLTAVSKSKESVLSNRLGNVPVINAAQQYVGIDRETHN